MTADSPESSAFLGSIPVAYDTCLVPLIFEPYAADLGARAARLAPRAVLETACGTGALTRRLREVLPAGTTIVATDLSSAMLARARERDPHPGTVNWQPADACALPFPDASVDLVIFQFGLMFYQDKVEGLREARRVLRPGGHCLTNVWDGFESNPMGRLPHDVLAEFFPQDPPGFYRIPFSLTDHGALRTMFRAAGFGEPGFETVVREGVSPSALEAATGMITGTPAWSALMDRGVTDPGPLVARLTAKLERAGGKAPFRIPMQATVITAQAPA